MTTKQQSATLYRHYNSAGQLLYVGQTMTMFARMLIHAHGRDTHWVREVATITLVHYNSRAEARDAEWLAVNEEKPLYNKKLRKPAPARIMVDMHLNELTK